MRNNKFIVPVVTGLVIVLTLFLTIIIKSGTSPELALLLAYSGIGIIGFGYSALLRKFKMALASNVFLILTILSGTYFYINMPTKGSGGLSQLAEFIGWLFLMALSLALSLIIGLITRLKNK